MRELSTKSSNEVNVIIVNNVSKKKRNRQNYR